MKVYQTKEIRNIALLGSSGSGKTTLAEAILLEGGVIKRRGNIAAGNTVSDYFPVEKEYGYSVFSTLISTEWMDRKLNFIDCPGADDFAGAIVSALSVADIAVMVVNAQYGIEVGMINQFRHIDRLNKPSIFLINQLDSDKADYEAAIAQLKERYGSRIVPVQYPVNQGAGFNTVVDVLKMKMYKYGAEGSQPEVTDIPQEQMPRAKEMHQALVEAAAENDEALMEKFFDQGSLSEEEMREGIRAGLLSRSISPVFCVSAEKCVGVGRSMEFLGNVVPSPGKMAPVLSQEGEEVGPDASAPTSLYFFKSSIEPHIGEVSYFKVMSGTLKEGDDLENISRGSKERISQIFVCAGQTRTKVESMVAGDIGATVKLKDVRRGNTLNAKGVTHSFDLVEYPQPKYRRAVRAKNEAESEKLGEILNRMHEEDPTWVVEQSKELRQLIVGGQGEFHLRTLKWRIENNDKVEIEFMEPRIPYRETITKPARSDYRHKKQSGGAGQFGEVHLIVEPYEDGKPMPETYKFGGQEFKITARDTQEIPLEWGGKLVFVNSVVGGAIDTRFMPAILKGIMGRMERGPLTGSYARDVRVIVYDGKMHPVDSNEISFMLAGRNAFSQAFREAVPKVLEPIYNVEVSVPADYMGDVMSDLQGRRAIIMGMESRKGYELIKARVPLAELSSYSTTLSSVTGGRASFVMSFDNYELVPGDTQEKLLQAYAAEQASEE
ncbi:elongation factor G [Porphyromonas crevioricanis]|uniref:Elongation factor G n=2 Tax=Porphyromonas crevioricanis TaxID=393921 RepID=A0A0A2G4C9_9PORP|nr:elongation factor G [Porphyromonas crevioricanis]KGN90345.1 elongation factor G [Porphyromonas crevioricanis]KGN95314.1 elongation factor G [Porphyromonas crevioricanis]SJZ60523.1 elongation factor G [Porphyromonas crevioricanis]SQH72790.1 Elongation factor G [Porphyromonas crevioricanis]GAD05669.1 translation elongation factor G-related protein [Porphyromonas crevioricanis JCM 15906]